jgi:integrase/recombinase XerD
MFEQFVKERVYLKNVSPPTVDFDRDCWRSFERYGGELTKAGLAKYVTSMREAGVKPVSCNTFISGINAYLRWLHEEYDKPLLKIQKLKVEQTVIPHLPESTISAVVSFKPGTFGEQRLRTILLSALDTGCRIDELLTLKRTNLDFDNLCLKVLGKGKKERIVPFSVELRKVLRIHDFDFVFPTRHGGKISYHNLNRDYRNLCEKLKIKKEGSFHRLRHTFALNYVRNGGGLIHLQKQLGHTSLQMTRRYTELETTDLQRAHTSILSRLRP